MPKDRKLRVGRSTMRFSEPDEEHGNVARSLCQEESRPVVVLECSEDRRRVGDFEEWMVEWLDSRSFDVLPRAFVGAHTVDTPDTAIEAEADAAIAAVISRILKEAEDV